MKDGQTMEQDIIRGKAPVVHEHRRVTAQIFMGQHNPLRPARCSRGIKQYREVFWCALRSIKHSVLLSSHAAERTLPSGVQRDKTINATLLAEGSIAFFLGW